jgi:hypothetical protein
MLLDEKPLERIGQRRDRHLTVQRGRRSKAGQIWGDHLSLSRERARNWIERVAAATQTMDEQQRTARASTREPQTGAVVRLTGAYLVRGRKAVRQHSRELPTGASRQPIRRDAELADLTLALAR